MSKTSCGRSALSTRPAEPSDSSPRRPAGQSATARTSSTPDHDECDPAGLPSPGPTSCTSGPTGSTRESLHRRAADGRCRLPSTPPLRPGPRSTRRASAPAPIRPIWPASPTTRVARSSRYRPSDLAAVLPSITPKGIDHVEIDGVTVPIDGLGNFDMTVPCPANSPPQPSSSPPRAGHRRGEHDIDACITLTCYNLRGNGVVDPDARSATRRTRRRASRCSA